MTIDDERQAIVAEALTWSHTPFHHGALLKGIGTDCRFVAQVYKTLGLDLARIEIAHHPMDWNLHQDREYYLEAIEPYAVEVTDPLPGDLVLWKFGRTFAHSGIVVKWPHVVHGFNRQPVFIDDINTQIKLRYNNDKPRAMKCFTLKRWVVDNG